MLTRKQHELLTFIDRHLQETGFSPSFEEMKDMLQLKSKSGIHRLITALEERGFLARRHHRARALEVIRLPNEIRSRVGAVATVAAETAAGIAPAWLASAGVSPVGVSSPGALLPGFAPNVIHGHFAERIPGVRAANDSVSTQLPMYGRIATGLSLEAMHDTTTRIEVPVAMLGNGEHYALEVAGDSMIEAGILDGDTVLIRNGGVAENGQIVVALVDGTEVTLKRLRRRGNSIALEPCNVLHETRVFPAVRVKVQGLMVALLRRYI
jgi:repressor LexA